MAQSLEILSTEYCNLRKYLGELKFKSLVNEYVSRQPQTSLNTRRLVQQFPIFISTYPNFIHFPEITELAELEWAMNQAFAAVELLPLTLEKILKLSSKKLKTHPSVTLLKFSQNTTSIWSALKCDETPPRPHLLDGPQNVIVWRQGPHPRFRILGDDEAEALRRLSSGMGAKELKSESYLQGWIEAELLLAPAAAA